MATRGFPHSIYIPLCDEDKGVCYSWLQEILRQLKEKGLVCQAEHPINGKYLSWFKKFFEKSNVTIIHFCPFLWKRIRSLNDYVQKQDDRLILLRITPMEQQTQGLESVEPSLQESLISFFDEMDSEQRINNHDDVSKFVEKIISSTTPRSRSASVESLEHTTTESVTSYTSSSCSRTHLSSMSYNGINEQFHQYLSDNPSCDCENFERYYDIFGSVSDMSVFVRSCDAQWISPTDFTYMITSELVQKIDEFKADNLQDMNYILHKLLPMLFQEKRILELSSIITCKWNILRERALLLLEFILWESGPGPDSEIKNMKDMANIDHYLLRAMQKIREEYVDSRGQTDLMHYEQLAHVSLMLLSNLIIMSGTNSGMAKAAKTILDGRNFAHSDSFGQPDPSQESLKVFLADGENYLQVYDTATKYLQTKFPLKESEAEFTPKKLLKESFCVQSVVLFELIKRVFSLLKEPLEFLGDYVKQVKSSKIPWKKKNLPSIACITMLCRGLTMFVNHSTRKKEHMDIKEICKHAMDVITLAAQRVSTDEIDRSLLPLLFDPRDLVRQEVKKIFKDKESCTPENLLKLGANMVEHLLIPFVKEVTHTPPQTSSEEQSQVKSTKQPPEWNIFKLKYNNTPGQMFLCTISQTDHEKQNKALLKKQEDLHYTEILNLIKLKHEHIIDMFAYQINKMPQFYILEGGHERLQVALENARTNQKFLEHKLLCKFLLDALKGLKYCHNLDHIHRNLTAYSLCIFNMKHVKLCDFGLCMKEASSEVFIELNSKTIPLRWSAPESIFAGEFSKSSDIWMVGHLIYEVLTHGLLPYSFMFSDDKFTETLHKIHEREIHDSILPREQCLDDRTFDLITKCSQCDSSSRPSVEEVLTILLEIHETTSELPEARITYPRIDDQHKLSVDFLRGVPRKYCIRNIIKSKSASKGLQIIKITDSTSQICMTDRIVIEEKLVHPLSVEASASIHSNDFQGICPLIKLHKNSDEVEHIKCEIPRSSRKLYDLALKKSYCTSVYMMLMCKVAETISQLHSLSWIIGDLSPSSVFVNTKTLKPDIVSFSLLKSIGHQDTSNSMNTAGEEMSPIVQSRAAPEVISNGLFSTASDVFCFGNFMWVLLSAFDQPEKPLSEVNDNEIKPFGHLSKKEWYQLLMTGQWREHNKQPLCCPDQLYSLILQCVSINTKERPSMLQISEHLKKLFDENEINDAIRLAGQEAPTSPIVLVEANPSEASFISSSTNFGRRSSEKSKKKRLSNFLRGKDKTILHVSNPSVSSRSSISGKS